MFVSQMADPADQLAELHLVLQTCGADTQGKRNAIAGKGFNKITDLQALEGDDDVKAVAKKLNSRARGHVEMA